MLKGNSMIKDAAAALQAAFATENASNLSMDFFPYFCYDNNHFFFSLLQRCTEETL